jgi:uncharacterized protein (DUF1501 family)
MSSRRDFLRMLAAAPVAVSAPALAAASTPQRLLVMVFLYGGNDGYNTFVPYANPLYYRLRPNIAVASDSVLKVTPTHGFHPSLASLMPAWEAKDLALVQGLGYPECTQQHYRDIESAFTGCDGREFSAEGWVTRALAGTQRDAIADAIAFDMLDIPPPIRWAPFAARSWARCRSIAPTTSCDRGTSRGTSSMRRRADARCSRARRTTSRP